MNTRASNFLPDRPSVKKSISGQVRSHSKTAYKRNTILSLAQMGSAQLRAASLGYFPRSDPLNRAACTPMSVPSRRSSLVLWTTHKMRPWSTGAARKASGIRLCYRHATVVNCSHTTASSHATRATTQHKHGELIACRSRICLPPTQSWMPRSKHIWRLALRCSHGGYGFTTPIRTFRKPTSVCWAMPLTP